ncbi:hypothetical protein NL676_000733 [Syzygium grande]|nr:hypothetical protein NL676_000733 [Syzygium grande]
MLDIKHRLGPGRILKPDNRFEGANGSKVRAHLFSFGFPTEDFGYRLDPRNILEPDERFKGGKISVRLPDYPMEILNQGSSTIAPGFHEHHFSGRCPPKISARVIFSGVSDSRIDIAAEVPLWDTGIMSSSEPILYLKNLILMLASWLERKRVSKWMHDFRRKDEALLSLEFCNHCMSITSENGGFSPSPLCLECVDPSPQLSIMVSMTLDNYGYSRVENLEILTKFSLPSLRSHSLLLKGPCSSEKLQYSIRMFNLWHEKATRVQGSASRRSFKNCKLCRLRKTRWGISRNKRKRNLSDRLCLDEYLDKRLLMYSGYFYACQYSLSPLPKTKLDYCHYVLEQAFAFLDGPLDFKQKTRMIRESSLVVEWMREIIDLETPTVQEAYQFFKDMRTIILVNSPFIKDSGRGVSSSTKSISQWKVVRPIDEKCAPEISRSSTTSSSSSSRNPGVSLPLLALWGVLRPRWRNKMANSGKIDRSPAQYAVVCEFLCSALCYYLLVEFWEEPLEAWQPISVRHKRRWWECIALPEDVDPSDEAVFRMEIKELAFKSLQLLKAAIFDKECEPRILSRTLSVC